MVRIDCGTSNACEVERAEATIREAAFVNPNHPRLDIFRHFEAVMIRDDKMPQIPDETRETEEEVTFFSLPKSDLKSKLISKGVQFTCTLIHYGGDAE
jgi:hypothetical protein